MFAISMALFLFAMFAVAVDLTELYAAHVRFADAAEQAAMAGAGQVDYASAKAGFPQVSSTYQSVCTATGDSDSGLPGSTVCQLTAGNVVVATVSAQVSVPIPLFGAGITVTATYRAAPVLGGLQPVA
jgi:Flp pilus assembly protein TadG